MEMLEEQQREEMELAALQEEQENEQVRQQQNISKSTTNFSKFKKLWKPVYYCSVRIKSLKMSKSRGIRFKLSSP